MTALLKKRPVFPVAREHVDDQLLMPWGEPHQVVLLEGRLLGELNEFDLVYSLTRQGRHLSLLFSIVSADNQGRIETRSALLLDLGPEATCTRTQEDLRWNHNWELGVEKLVEFGPFSELCEWSLGFLVGIGMEEGGRWTSPVALSVHALCNFAEQKALEFCNPRALEVSRGYCPSRRFEIYALTLRYGERIAQMAEVCPGLLLLVLALRDRAPGSEHRILSSIIRGEKLRTILNDAWCEWSSGHLAQTKTERIKARDQLTYLRLVPGSVELPASVLTLPQGVEVNDIPQDLGARETWYGVMVHLATQIAPLKILGSPAVKTLTGFFSHHALQISRSAFQKDTSMEATIAELVDYVVRSRPKVPSRHSAPLRVLQAVTHWHLTTWRFSKYPPDTPLRACNLRAPEPPLSAVALTTVAELQAEGRKMHHCVAAYSKSAVTGKLFVYRATFREERLTISLKIRDRCLQLVEVKAKCNRLASGQAKNAIRLWIDMDEDALLLQEALREVPLVG